MPGGVEGGVVDGGGVLLPGEVPPLEPEPEPGVVVSVPGVVVPPGGVPLPGAS